MSLKIYLAALFGFSLGLSPLSSKGLETISKQVILLDAKTGTVLFERNADERMAPSSMSKIMTMYQLFEALKDGSLSENDKFLVSEKAWRKPGSKMFVSVNSRVKVLTPPPILLGERFPPIPRVSLSLLRTSTSQVQ